MTTIDGQLWQRCVECGNLVPAGARNFYGVCLVCAPPAALQPPAEDLEEIAAGDVGEPSEEVPA